MSRGLGNIQKKILISLSALAIESIKYTRREQQKIFAALSKEFERVERSTLRNAITGLKRNKMITLEQKQNGIFTIKLSNKGKEKILECKLEELKILRPQAWDEKWRMVMFDIPDFKKKAREALRSFLKQLGFHQYQQSIFIHPFPCYEELNFIIEFYELSPHVKFIEVPALPEDGYFREIFKSIIPQ